MYFKLAKVLAVMIVMHASTTGMRFTATLDALAHGGTSFEVGAMLSMVALVPAFFALSAGRLLDRLGPRRPIYFGLLCVFAAGMLTLLFPTDSAGLAPLFGACLLVGVAFMLSNTVVQRLAGDVATPETRTTAFSIMAMTASASGVLTPVITGYVIERAGYSAFYSFCIGASIVMAVMLMLPAFVAVYPRTLKTKSKARQEKGRAVDFLKRADLRAMLAVSVMISVAWEVGNLLIPVYCASVQLSPSEIGWILGSFSAATFAVRLLMPLFLRFLSDWQMITGTLFVGGAAFAVFPFFTNLFELMATAFLLGMGLGASLPNILSLMYKLSPPGRIGEVIGLRLMLMNLSKAGFPVAMGALGAVIGAGTALWGLAVFLLCGGVYAVGARKTVTESKEKASPAH